MSAGFEGLPLGPPVAPQLAGSAKEPPRGDGWLYEPKLDGYRAIVFVAGDRRYVQSRGGKPLDRYFPELSFPPGRYVVDGEVVIDDPEGGQDFEMLSQRIHPAASRIARLAREWPARFAAFDLLALGDESLLERPRAERRALAAEGLPEGLALMDGTVDPDAAELWLETGEGLIAKELAAPYRPGERLGMVKVKRRRTIDCVVMGWRPGTVEDTVGSLILGLYDGEVLRPVGHSASFTAARKRELREMVRPLESGERGSGEPSRWSAGRDSEWVGMRPELVAEVTYDHASGGRIRHGARLVRFRPDRDPRSCLFEQLGVRSRDERPTHGGSTT
jgi:ATP-dependent DNA ligase